MGQKGGKRWENTRWEHTYRRPTGERGKTIFKPVATTPQADQHGIPYAIRIRTSPSHVRQSTEEVQSQRENAAADVAGQQIRRTQEVLVLVEPTQGRREGGKTDRRQVGSP